MLSKCHNPNKLDKRSESSFMNHFLIASTFCKATMAALLNSEIAVCKSSSKVLLYICTFQNTIIFII